MNHNSANAPRRAPQGDTPSPLSRARGASQPVPTDALDKHFTPQSSDIQVSSAAPSSQGLRRANVYDPAAMPAQTHSRRPASEGSQVRRSIVDAIHQSDPQLAARKVSGVSQSGATHQVLPPRRQRTKKSQLEDPLHSGDTRVLTPKPIPKSSAEQKVRSRREFEPRAARMTQSRVGAESAVRTTPAQDTAGAETVASASAAAATRQPGRTPNNKLGPRSARSMKAANTVKDSLQKNLKIAEQSDHDFENHEVKRPELAEVSPGRHKKKRSKTWLALREVLMVFVVAIAISALIKAFLIQAFIIPSESMEDTLLPQDRVLVSKLVPSIRQINRGDILVFEDTDNWLNTQPDTSPMSYVKRILITLGLRPDDSQNHLIKRVIGLPGDHVQCCDKNGNLVVNGISVKEPYLKPGVNPSDISFDVYVPADKLWMMGDNRANSGDSRAHMEAPSKGFVNISSVTGRAFVIMWPYSRWKTLSNSDAFAAVPSLPQ